VSEERPIGVIGVGWVGLVTATCFAEMGHDVVAMDIDAQKIGALNRNQVPIHEPEIDELLERNADRLTFTTEMEDVLESARLLFCCVDTPPTYSGDADLSRVQAVVARLADDGDHALVMKSTVPSGTGRAIRRNAPDVTYISCPEFLKEGTAVRDFLHPDRVVIGADPGAERAADEVEALYRPLGGEIVRTDVASAEMIKLAANAFLATKISFINEIANVCEEVGADVTEVARGMGFDKRIGPSFLRAGVGYGGSCLAGEESVMARANEESMLITLQSLFDRLAPFGRLERTEDGVDVLQADGLEVLSWRRDSDSPEYLPAQALTRRKFTGELYEIRTKMGRTVRCTPDHPFVVSDARGETVDVKLARELTSADWLPMAQGSPLPGSREPELLSLESARVHAGVLAGQVIVRPADEDLARLREVSLDVREQALASHPRGHVKRFHDIVRAGALRLPEAERLEVSLSGASAGTVSNGTYVPTSMLGDARFWRVIGLYIAEGHCSQDGQRQRLQWSFHPFREMHLVNEVASFWRENGVKAAVRQLPTTTTVSVSSRLLAGWWCGVLGLGRNCYEQRIPDLLWHQAVDAKRAVLSGLWLGDGSWSYVNAGPSVTLEYGTASRELADGILRLLSELHIVASLRVGRTAKSTCDNYWLRISGADQVESMLDLVDSADQTQIRNSLERQAKRIAPTGYRRRQDAAWVRVTQIRRGSFDGDVFSVEVPESGTFVTTGSLVVHNCFPKDVSALKQLAGNTGYHFQLLTAVIEVNELQKRRVIGKLQKHLGSLAGKTIALLGLAFKPDTDDMREASSLVLASRLEGEGASVRGYDPVAGEHAKQLLPTVELCASAEEALEGADAAVIVTEWPEFAELDWSALRGRMAQPVVVDGRNFLDPKALRESGFAYEGIGLATGDSLPEEGAAPAETAQARSR
jgi:UDPglucose 6-dehydrogenase